MADFTDEHKKEMVPGNYFAEGIHKVKIVDVVFGKTDADKEYAEFEVIGEEGEEGKARIWFTTDAAKGYSFNTVRSIFVHNTKDESKKDKTRAMVDAVTNTTELAKLCEALKGKECWYAVYKSERTYVGKDGQSRNSFDRNVYGYEPKPKAPNAVEKAAKEIDGEITSENVDSVFPF